MLSQGRYAMLKSGCSLENTKTLKHSMGSSGQMSLKTDSTPTTSLDHQSLQMAHSLVRGSISLVLEDAAEIPSPEDTPSQRLFPISSPG